MVKSPKHRMHHINSWNSSDLPVYRKQKSHPVWMGFCFAASFYFSSTTLYCTYYQHFVRFLLLLLPQRYEFSSKSQPLGLSVTRSLRCCCYRKGTNFQANHNNTALASVRKQVVVATAKVRIFKQITTRRRQVNKAYGCCCYRKGTNFQANHNPVFKSWQLKRLLLLPQRYEFSSKSQLPVSRVPNGLVVVATAKVRIFKQITTSRRKGVSRSRLLLLPQRYEFSSKSQHGEADVLYLIVVVATAKVRIFKQITTLSHVQTLNFMLLLLPQRYEFSSKSQLNLGTVL